jgi:hypothetical protein
MKKIHFRGLSRCATWILVLTVNVAIMPAGAAQAQKWYLMAPDEKIMSDPRVATRMEHGPVVGPMEFISVGEFSSRSDCEPARRKLIAEWRSGAVLKRGTWDKYGFTSPSYFVRCVSADDPQLKHPPAGTGTLPSMETFVNRPTRR